MAVVDLAVFDVAHALVATDAQGQDGAHHAAAVDNVVVEEQVRVGLALPALLVDAAHQRTTTHFVKSPVAQTFTSAMSMTLQEGPPKRCRNPGEKQMPQTLSNSAPPMP